MALIGIAQTGEDVPRRRDRQKEQDAAGKAKFPPAAPIAGEQKVRDNGCKEKHWADQAFGEHGERQRGPSNVNMAGLLIFQSGEEAIESEGQQKSNQGFGDEDAGEEKDADTGENAQSGIESRAVTVGPPAPYPDKNRQGKNAQAQRQVRSKDIVSKDAIIDRGQPVRERRFFRDSGRHPP